MRKSLNDIQQIENYVFCRMSEQEHHDFQVRLLIDPGFQSNVDWQKEAYALIKAYGRRKLKAEINAVQENIWNRPDKQWFRQKIKNLFSKKP